MGNTGKKGSGEFAAPRKQERGIGNMVRSLAFVAAAVPIFGDALPANAEAIFRIGADGGLRAEDSISAMPRVAERKLLEDPRVAERLNVFKDLFGKGDFASAMSVAQSISDFYWSQNHGTPQLSRDGSLTYPSNEKRFVEAPGCVNDLRGRGFSFLGRDAFGALHSIMPAHAIDPKSTSYAFTKFADVATRERPSLPSTPCIEIAKTSATSHFQIGVTMGREQLGGVIFPLQPLIQAGVRFDLSVAQTKVPHLDLDYIMNKSPDVVCTILPSAIREEQLKATGISTGSGSPLVTINGERIQAVGMQMNVTPISFKVGESPKYVLCYASADQINDTIGTYRKPVPAQ